MKGRHGFILLFCAYRLIEGVLWAMLFTADGLLPIWLYVALMAMVVGAACLMKERRSGRSVHEEILLGGLCGAVPVIAAVFYRFDGGWPLPLACSSWGCSWNGAGTPLAVGRNGAMRSGNTANASCL